MVADDRDEDAAIYLLQVLHSVREYDARIQRFRDDGYAEPEPPVNGDRDRYRSVAVIGREYHGGRYGTVKVLSDARVAFIDGQAVSVLPRGKRTHGYRVSDGFVLVRA